MSYVCSLQIHITTELRTETHFNLAMGYTDGYDVRLHTALPGRVCSKFTLQLHWPSTRCQCITEDIIMAVKPYQFKNKENNIHFFIHALRPNWIKTSTVNTPSDLY